MRVGHGEYSPIGGKNRKFWNHLFIIVETGKPRLGVGIATREAVWCPLTPIPGQDAADCDLGSLAGCEDKEGRRCGAPTLLENLSTARPGTGKS